MGQQKKQVLILGGGFGGIKTALELESNASFEVRLLSDQDSFRYYPTLYRAAVGGSPLASAIPLSEIFKGKRVNLIKDTVKQLDRDSNTVFAASGKSYNYDVLIVALGVVTNFYGIKGLKHYAYGIKTLEEAKRLHDHLHQQLMQDSKSDVHYVVIGGGPTGVELAGVLPSYIEHILKCHGLSVKNYHVDLVEAAHRPLPQMSKTYSKAVARRLRRLGVRLYLGQAVEAASADHLTLNGHDIKSHTIVWTAGVTSHPFLEDNGFRLGHSGKAAVNNFLQAQDNIYVIGDNAETPYSGMAQTALHDASYVASNLKRLTRGKKPKSYVSKKPVYVIPAGPNWAAVAWGGIHIYGWLGWWLRRAADFIAYHDVEPWWQATEHWLESVRSQETCPICSVKK
ncbi:FAD-dependent oxidoreductase [Candidatus Saccharibacteria bacterium]|nr:FAD-dependent oxidoreductase [Candidatus Saccharibacteria bacterium]